MIIGNTASQQAIRDYIHKAIDPAIHWSVFLLVTGPKNIGKTSFIHEIAKEVLGIHMMQDFLFVRDMSEEIKKNHTLIIGNESGKEKILTLEDGTEYKDIGMRDITYRLQQSGVSGHKIVLLENIERMNASSANAFLKAAEEPLPGRIIIATASHKSQVLETILSRAITVPFHELTDDEMKSFCDSKQISLDTETEELFLSMAMGRPGKLLQLVQQTDADTKQLFLTALHTLQTRESLHAQYMALTNIYKVWYLEMFLDARIARWSEKNGDHIKQRLRVKKNITSNVSIEHLLLYGIIS